MEDGVQQFKYIIIDTNSKDIVLCSSFREIADFINTLVDCQISHNTVGKRLAVNNHFAFNHLIIKALLWS
tara:strand:- start:552 stop:761 length:210 start_codon:yes stop_codon:yes gene_type:complete